MKTYVLHRNVKLWLRTLVLLLILVPLTAAAQAPFVVKEIAGGSPIHGANGLYFDAQDNLYIASVFGGEILVMDPLNGKIIKTLGDEAGVVTPDDVTIGPDGSLYWTDFAIGEVGRLDPDGNVTKQLIAPGVNPITFSEEGRLFVALDFFGDGLYELDPELQGPARPAPSSWPAPKTRFRWVS